MKKTWNNFVTNVGKAALNKIDLKIAMLQVSKRCPYFCKYCYQGSSANGKVLELKRVKEIIKKLRDQQWLIQLVIAELVPEIIQFLPLMKEYKVHDISTAGDPLIQDPTWFDTLKKHKINELRIVVFPTDEIHQEWTGRRRKNALKAIKMGLDRGFRIVWNFLLSKTTSQYLKNQVKEVKTYGVHEFNINNFFAFGRGLQFFEEMLDKNALLECLEEYSNLRKRYTVDELILTRTGMIGPNLINSKSVSAQLADWGEYCFAGFGKHVKLIFIDVDGGIYGCLTHRHPDLQIGKILQDGAPYFFDKKSPMESFDRKNCFTVFYLKNLHKNIE